MNFTTEQLLQLPPFEAALIAYNDQHGTQLNPRFVELDGVVNNDGSWVTIRLKAREDNPNKEDRRFNGQCTITIERLDLGETIGTVKIPYIDSITTPDVGSNITKQVGIIFDENDFIKDVITETNTVVRANPESLRWYGEMTVEKA